MSWSKIKEVKVLLNDSSKTAPEIVEELKTMGINVSITGVLNKRASLMTERASVASYDSIKEPVDLTPILTRTEIVEERIKGKGINDVFIASDIDCSTSDFKRASQLIKCVGLKKSRTGHHAMLWQRIEGNLPARPTSYRELSRNKMFYEEKTPETKSFYASMWTYEPEKTLEEALKEIEKLKENKKEWQSIFSKTLQENKELKKRVEELEERNDSLSTKLDSIDFECMSKEEASRAVLDCGKYRFRTYKELLAEDAQYASWLYNSSKRNVKIFEALCDNSNYCVENMRGAYRINKPKGGN